MQICVPGDDSFDDIYDVSPFLDMTYDLDQDVAALPSPRIFKTHQRLSAVQKEANPAA